MYESDRPIRRHYFVLILFLREFLSFASYVSKTMAAFQI